MKRGSVITIVLGMGAVLAGGGWALNWREAEALRREIALLREAKRGLAKLQAENVRLKAEQTPAAEIERWRADHAAVLRLRGEVEEMKRRVEAAGATK